MYYKLSEVMHSVCQCKQFIIGQYENGSVATVDWTLAL